MQINVNNNKNVDNDKIKIFVLYCCVWNINVVRCIKTNLHLKNQISILHAKKLNDSFAKKNVTIKIKRLKKNTTKTNNLSKKK